MIGMNLKEIKKPVEKLIDSTNNILSSTVMSDVSLINDIKKLVPFTKGKKIRSMLLFLLSGMNNNLSEDLPVVASSVELFHLSSLIHDDILDNAKLRRGEKTLNDNFGNLISVLGGDFLFVHSLNLMNSLTDRELMNILLLSTKIMVEGQIQEIENNFNHDISFETYNEIIEKKTSSLFAAVSEMAAAINGFDKDKREQFYRFGINFGNIFQISDDLLDIFSNTSGKEQFKDLIEGKTTLPYILLRDKCDCDVKKYFSSEHREKLLELFEEYNIKELSLKKVDEYYAECLEFLETFPDSAYKDSLQKLLAFIRYRDY
ncbi:MAG: polyprenyl synthetase family protein [Acidobacteriota bacterium]